MAGLIRRVTDYLNRREACRLAATTLCAFDIEEGITPTLWSLAVFYENYLCGGAEGTRADFGPHEPVALREVSTIARPTMDHVGRSAAYASHDKQED